MHDGIEYLRRNAVAGFVARPVHLDRIAYAFVPFAVCLVAFGMISGLMHPSVLHIARAPLVALGMFVWPSLLEEAFFRGVMIPRSSFDRGPTARALSVFWSTVAFVVWHPLNALTYNRGAIPVFLDARFLLLAGLLGLFCGAAYVSSRSLWIPVAIHWITVLVWVFFFGGRNLLLSG